jgi:hypothetical protein
MSGRTGRTAGSVAASSSTTATTRRARSFPTYTTGLTSANFRGPAIPQGYYPIQSHDGRHRVRDEDGPRSDFIFKNMVKPGPRAVFTN